jgi:hypothetical protein
MLREKQQRMSEAFARRGPSDNLYQEMMPLRRLDAQIADIENTRVERMKLPAEIARERLANEGKMFEENARYQREMDKQALVNQGSLDKERIVDRRERDKFQESKSRELFDLFTKAHHEYGMPSAEIRKIGLISGMPKELLDMLAPEDPEKDPADELGF